MNKCFEITGSDLSDYKIMKENIISEAEKAEFFLSLAAKNVSKVKAGLNLAKIVNLNEYI